MGYALARRSLAHLGVGAVLAAGFAAVASLGVSPSKAEEVRRVPPPAVDEPVSGSREVAVVAGGCFWGVQGVFQHVDGVACAVSGYAGGAAETAHYDMTSQGDTGHAESVRDRVRPGQDQLRQALADLFLGRPRPDRAQPPGSGRRDAIPLRRSSRRAKRRRMSRRLISPSSIRRTRSARRSSRRSSRARPSIRAEAYHQDFLAQNPTYPYIVFNDLPKIANLKRLFPELYRPDPVLVGAKS